MSTISVRLKGGGGYQHPDDDDDKFCDNFFTKFGDKRNVKFGVDFGDHISTNCAEDFWDTSARLMTNLSPSKVTYSRRDTILMIQKIIQCKAFPEIKSKCIV